MRRFHSLVSFTSSRVLATLELKKKNRIVVYGNGKQNRNTEKIYIIMKLRTSGILLVDIHIFILELIIFQPYILNVGSKTEKPYQEIKARSNSEHLEYYIISEYCNDTVESPQAHELTKT